MQKANDNHYSNLIKNYAKKELQFELIPNLIDNLTVIEIQEHYKSIFAQIFSSRIEEIRFIANTNNILKKNTSLSTDFVKYLNESKFIRTIFDEEGQHFVKDDNLLHSSVEGVFNGYYRDRLEEFAVSWFRLINNHPFSNGNKRSAFISIKITIIIDLLVNILDEYFSLKLFKPLEDQSKIYLKKIQKKRGKKLNAKKISRKEIKDITFRVQEILKTSYQEELKKFIDSQIVEIAKIWSNPSFIKEDYLLSFWIIANSNSMLHDQHKKEIYNILRNNLIFFICTNNKSILKNASKFATLFLNDKKRQIEVQEKIDNYLRRKLV